jgi:hypothetical protein
LAPRARFDHATAGTPARGSRRVFAGWLDVKPNHLAPNHEWSTKFGRTRASIFQLAQTAAGLRFTKVTIACKEDEGALIVAARRKT